jgi:DeoR/GlpR family transcriptional regulator of sugar metabolism
MRVSMEQADRTLVMGGDGCLGLISNHQVASIRELDLLITDQDANPELIQALRDRALEVVQV